jgi:hypothetical protein
MQPDPAGNNTNTHKSNILWGVGGVRVTTAAANGIQITKNKSDN